MSIHLDLGILIAVEGIDGAGKTTQASAIATRLAALGFEVVQTKEPTGGPWGQRLRNSAQSGRLTPAEELRAFIEDRREHVANLIRPALARGAVVIVDRYYFSTAAYQGARGLDVSEIIAANAAFAPAPDLLLLLEVDPAVGVARIRGRGDEANLFEREEDLRRSAAIFAAMDFPYLLRVDGHLSPTEVTRLALGKLHDGPARLRLCAERRSKDGPCAIDGCRRALTGDCQFLLVGPLAPIECGDLVDRVNAIAADRTVSPEAQVEAVRKLVQGEKA